MTEEAIKAAKSLISNQPENQPLRLYIEGKNCDGFTYGISFDNRGHEDHLVSFDDIDLIIDKDSYPFLDEVNIDWQTIEGQSGFVITNPNQKKFRGKFFKRKGWQERLLES